MLWCPWELGDLVASVQDGLYVCLPHLCSRRQLSRCLSTFYTRRFALGAFRNIWSLILKVAKGNPDKTELVDYRLFSLHSVELFSYSAIRAELLTHVKLQANIIKGIISYHKRFEFPLKFWVNLAVCFFQNIFNTNHWRNINPCLFLRIGEKHFC